ncbi:MAG: FAD-binding oxidoreductase, partial [Hyphomicrobiales bacterium]|nr:FAD-binding oxidoreductase [Hyphomicrobiales bacterium]
DGPEFALKTTRGEVAARDVFVATHGYGGNELGWMKRRVINFGWYAIATEELPPERLHKLLPGARACADSKLLFNYFRLNPQGTRLIFGGRAPIFEMPPARAAPFLARAMRNVFPDLDTVQVSHAWSGQIAFSFDLLPHIGSHDGIHYATSFTGPGMPLANYLGDKVARRVLGEADTATAFDGIALEGRPYYWGTAWFMPAAMAWYAARDRFSR